MTGPRFDYTFNVGHIVALLAFAGTLLTSHIVLNGRVEGVEKSDVRQDSRLRELELSDIDNGKIIAEMRTDVRYIREYVADEKAEQRRRDISGN